MNTRFLYTVLLLLISLKDIAQLIDEKEFTYYGPKDGLSNNYVSGLEQDAAGFMWIGTHNGLNRFDGKTFKHFFYNDKYNPIPDNSIYSMRLLQNDQLAIATDDGSQIISTKTLQQKNLSIDTDDKLRYWSNACRSVISDADGNYGISTKTGFYIFSAAGKLKTRYDFYTRKDIGEWMLFGDDMYPLPDGNMMQLNKNGVLLYDRKTNQFADATIKYPGLKDLVKEKDNNLFFFVSKYELVHINMETNSFDLIDIRLGKIGSFSSSIDFGTNIGWMTAPVKINDSTWAVNCKSKGFFLLTLNLTTKKISSSPQKYFADKLCTVFFVDRDKKLWIGTTEGFFKQNSHPKIVDSFALPNPTNKPVNITALYAGNERIFAGTADDRIFVLDKKTRNLLHHLQIPEVSYNVRTFYLFHPDTMWIGTGAGLWWLNLNNYSIGQITIDPDLKKTATVLLLFGDSKRNIWVMVNEENTIYFFDRVTGAFKLINNKTNPLFKTIPNSIAEDREGNIWMAGDAIVRWNVLTQRIDTLIEHLPGQKNMKKGYYVMADSKAEIWTTVHDDGLVNLTRSIHLRPENLLPEKTAFVSPAILQDKILMATANGPGFFDIINSKAVLFTAHDGVPNGIISSFFFIGDSTDGSVWFSCKNIICKLPLSSSTKQMMAPVLHLTGLSILDDTLINYPSEKIHLNHKQGNINILYSAVNYADPQNMRFSYRIKNKKDSSWIDAGDQQNILLTNISPGKYKLELRVSAYDNKWIEQIKEIEIDIKPPFWQTLIFFIAMALAFIVLVYYLYRYRINQINQKANLDKQLAQTEMKALHSQMNPHFIFNCLNSIREMILNNENEQASVYLSKFARLIRITLNQSSQQFVSLKDTIDYLERYIEMEKIRSNHFTYTTEISDDLQTDDIMMPPMLIQPFIENAIWHGTSSKKDLDVQVSFRKKENELVCVVEDNGIGIQESLRRKESTPNEPSVGIANIQQRIALLNEKYNLQSTVNIEDKAALPNNSTGTIVTLHLPIKINENLWAS